MGLLEKLGHTTNNVSSNSVKSDFSRQQESTVENPPAVDKFNFLKEQVHKIVVDDYNSAYKTASSENDIDIMEIIHNAISQQEQTLTRAEENRISQEIYDDVVGLGPIEPMLRDPSISEIMVNSATQIYVERSGKLTLTSARFRDDEHVLNVINRIVSSIGRRCDESSPLVDARLKDGSRVNAVIPPIALKGPSITIRKFSSTPLKIGDLISFNSMSHQMASFLEACVKGRCNIVVAGGTGSGKTTLLNVLSCFILENERIVTIEDAAELQLEQSHVVTLEGRPSNVEGKGAITIRDLVRNALRMRPDRIVVGEVRAGETLDMLQAMNTGHDGSLTTLHANSPRDVVSRLETMVMMAGMQLPEKAIREQIVSAIDVVVHQSRLRDGSRKVMNISEIIGMENGTVTMQDIFTFQPMGYGENGKLVGKFLPTGIHPKVAEKIKDNGIICKDEWFIKQGE